MAGGGAAPGDNRSLAREQAGRDQGLVRSVGTVAFAATIVNCVIGAGIFSLPSSMAAMAGHLAPVAFLLCAFAMGAVVLCCAEAAGRVATSGGCYGYADAAFGPLAGFVTGVLVWSSAVLACGGITAALIEGLALHIPMLADPGPRALAIVTLIGAIAAVNVAGASPAARLVTWLTVVKLAPLAILVIGGGLWLLGNPAVPAAPQPPTAFGQAVILALFAFSGMETPLAASGEVRDPARAIPRALFMAMGTVTALYIAIQFICQALLGPALPGASTPLADAMRVASPALGLLLLLGASLSRFAWLGSDILGAPRLLFAFARDGTLPAALGKVHPRTHTPHVAIWVHAGLAMALAITGTFEQLAIVSGLATAGIYLMACLSAWALHRRGVTTDRAAPHYALLPLAALIAVVAMVAIIALGQLRDIMGLALLVVVSILWFRFTRGSWR